MLGTSVYFSSLVKVLERCHSERSEESIKRSFTLRVQDDIALVDLTGFEPVTSSLQMMRSGQLSYRPWLPTGPFWLLKQKTGLKPVCKRRKSPFPEAKTQKSALALRFYVGIFSLGTKLDFVSSDRIGASYPCTGFTHSWCVSVL